MSAVGRSRWATLGLYGALTAVSLAWLVPAMTALMISILPLDDSRRGWWRMHLGDATLGNFRRAWESGLSDQVVNSFIITIGAVALTVATGVLAAYAFARLRFRGKRVT